MNRLLYTFLLASAALILCRDAASLAINVGDAKAASSVHATEIAAIGR